MTLWEKFFGQKNSAKSKRSRKDGYSTGFKAVPKDDRIEHPEIFDPALKQFGNGFRKGEPVFSEPSDGVAWRAVRERVINHLLKVFAESKLRDKLVVRGSVLLGNWFGKAARKPHDIDWVVVPQEIRFGKPEAIELLSDLLELIQNCESPYNIEFQRDKIAEDDIWTYDRAPGKRLIVPWTSGDLPPGFVQLDFVFEEELWCPAIEFALPHFSPGSRLLAASPEQSLAWKLLWLFTDDYPEGKDLYDAVLLAENYPIDSDLLKIALTDNGRIAPEFIGEDFVMQWHIEWDDFAREYPKVTGTAEQWKQRLLDAIEPAFTKLSF